MQDEKEVVIRYILELYNMLNISCGPQCSAQAFNVFWNKLEYTCSTFKEFCNAYITQMKRSNAESSSGKANEAHTSAITCLTFNSLVYLLKMTYSTLLFNDDLKLQYIDPIYSGHIHFHL